MGFIDTVVNWATTSGIKLLIAIIILIIAFKIINVVVDKLLKKLLSKGKVDETLAKTLGYAGKIALKILVVVCLIGYVGIETGGLSAVIASLGVCVGLAVNGTLSNLAGGVMIMVTRPFKLGDYIIAQGNEGTIEEIKICYTKMVTVDNKVVYLPNSGLSTGTIVNLSEKNLRRVDLDFAVAGNDPEKVKAVLLGICEKEDLVVKDPAPFARITDYGAGNGMTITMRAWCQGANYWDARFAILQAAEQEFKAEGIVVPFNQLDVHIKND